ncbi:MAG: NUDIX hydrolase [Hyphomicrobiaceae bacterium]
MISNDHLKRLNTADRPRVMHNLRPRDASSIVVIDNTGREPRMLVGKRHADQVFVPNKFVFPGGRVDPSDSRLKAGDDLNPLERDKLLLEMKGRSSPNRARGLALAAVRELFEETGLLIGRKHDGRCATKASGWRDFLDFGYVPSVQPLTYFARAITPPRRPRRYDTRFFVAMAKDIALQPKSADGELTELHWVTFSEARAFDLHVMTRTIVDEVEELLDARARPRRRKTVPFYYEDRGTFQRTLLRVG